MQLEQERRQIFDVIDRQRHLHHHHQGHDHDNTAMFDTMRGHNRHDDLLGGNHPYHQQNDPPLPRRGSFERLRPPPPAPQAGLDPMQIAIDNFLGSNNNNNNNNNHPSSAFGNAYPAHHDRGGFPADLNNIFTPEFAFETIESNPARAANTPFGHRSFENNSSNPPPPSSNLGPSPPSPDPNVHSMDEDLWQAHFGPAAP